MEERARCPGDFMAPSRYFFYPDPNPAVRDFGRQLGKRLELRVRELVKATIEDPQGEIARKMFIDHGSDPELLTRNLIGIMMGMLPPADGNLRGALHGWLKDNLIWRVQQRLAVEKAARMQALSAESEEARREAFFQCAKAAIEPPLREAMQKRPAPDMVWRTATRGHWLGHDKNKRVYVRAGERVFVGIVSATMESLGKGDGDVYPVFGGKREPYDAAAKRQPPPVHACPAYEMGMGTMLGMLTALLEAGAIEAHPAPLTVQLTRI